MEMSDRLVFSMTDASQVGVARRAGSTLGRKLGFDEAEAGKIAHVVSELGTNLVKHAREGELLLSVARDGAARGVGVLALDRGPGIANLAEALRDGYSTAGSPGTGLGAIRRLSATFDAYSAASGTAMVSFLWSAAPPRRDGVDVEGVSVPKPGEDVCGDAWTVVHEARRSLVLVTDGIGHGPDAAAAAAEACRVFEAAAPGSTALDALARLHDALRPTRGAAAAIAELDAERRTVRFAGVGNVAGTIVFDGRTRSMVSQHGLLGHGVRKMQDFSYPWPAGATIVLHSDGLATRWTFDGYPGLVRRHPLLAAGVLYRDFRRGNDDTTVVVVREVA